MLEELHVAGLALIDDATVEPGPGLTVLTGETGAGKTVLVGALGLLLGDRADSTLVRSGAAEALVEGRFRRDGAEHVVRRRVSAEGRSRCYLDGEMATVTALADAIGPLVDLHGQHDHQALLSAGTHAAYLDRAIGDDASAARSAYELAWRDAEARGREVARLRRALADRDARLELLRGRLAAIDAVAPHADEDLDIEARLPRLRHAERLAEAAAAAFRLLRGEGGAADAAAEAAAALRGARGLDPALDALGDALDEAWEALDDAGSRIRDYGETVEHDPAGLEEAESRAAAIAALKRTYGPTLDEVLAARAEAAADLEALDAGEEGLARAEAELAAAESRLVDAASSLSRVRAAAAPAFAERLRHAAAELSMPRAAFGVELAELPRASWSAEAHQRVEFTFASDAAEPLRPLSRIASGGEVSRVMLALKTVLGAADRVPVLVFDEVDVGIGGATATSVGRLLAQLAGRHQVLVVTHLAQVAVFADSHLVVEKTAGSDGRPTTRVRPIAGEERVAEVARMLSGGDSEASLAHARELLAAAAGGPV